MSSKRSFFTAVACALPLSLAACGSSDNNSDTPPVPEGQHYGYVVSSASIPTSDKQVTDFGLDLGSKTSSKPDGIIDNQLGRALSFLSGMVDIQGTVTTAIDQGNIILLVDVQTADLMNSNAAGFGVKIGASPQPPACDSATDTVCRHHLDGHGMFQIAANSPTDEVGGKLVKGAFTGGPGNVAIQIAIGSTTPIDLNLVHARVQATLNADNTITAKIGGLVTQTELVSQIGPVLQQTVMGLITTQCATGGAPPMCGCPTGSTAATLLSLNIDADHNCMITTDEILNFPVVKTELQPDSCSTDSCKTPDALSIGVQVQAVKAAFPGAM
jgi:hypothetical protein